MRCTSRSGVEHSTSARLARDRLEKRLLSLASAFLERLGVLIHGMQRAATPFHGGTLCVQTPLTRTPVTSSSGSTIGTGCTGTLAIDFNDVIQSYTDTRLVPGRTVCVQWWYRDGQSIGGSGLNNAASFVIAP